MAGRKKFIDIEVPVLRETVAVVGPIEKAEGKTIKLDLTRKLRGRSLEATLQIFNQDKPAAFPKKLLLLKAYIRRMMRKNASYVEDSFQTTCKDIRVTIKPFLITRKRVSKAVRRNLRNTTRDFLTNKLKEMIYLDAADIILHGELQKELLPKLKKVYPLSFCEIRVFETKELAKADLSKDQAPKEGTASEEEQTSEKKTNKATKKGAKGGTSEQSEGDLGEHVQKEETKKKVEVKEETKKALTKKTKKKE